LNNVGFFVDYIVAIYNISVKIPSSIVFGIAVVLEILMSVNTEEARDLSMLK
jgi:hypothetical protein